MSVLVKGMEMPDTGWITTIVIYPDGSVRTKRQDPLPYTAVPIPPHGDLIDRGKIGYFKDECNLSDFDFAYRSQIDSMPIIIPAEKGEESCT